MKVFEENHGISSRLFGGYDFVRVTDNLTVANIYSQDKYGNPKHTHEIYTDRKSFLMLLIISVIFSQTVMYLFQRK